jgi:hypothetical protein
MILEKSSTLGFEPEAGRFELFQPPKPVGEGGPSRCRGLLVANINVGHW